MTAIRQAPTAAAVGVYHDLLSQRDRTLMAGERLAVLVGVSLKESLRSAGGQNRGHVVPAGARGTLTLTA